MNSSKNRTKKRALVIAYKHFHTDPRIIREVNSLLDNGYLVDHICVNLHITDDIIHHQGNLNVYTITLNRKRGSIIRYLYEYLHFFMFAFYKTTVLLLRNRYEFIQVCTMPEPLVFTALFGKLTKTGIMMDWEDPTYELFLTKFCDSPLLKLRWLVKFAEWASCAFVDKIITPNTAFKDTFVARGVPADKIDIVLNAPDLRVFKPADPASVDRVLPYSLFFNGSVFHRHGLDLGIKAVALVKKQFPQIVFTIIGEGEADYVLFCRQLIKDLDLTENIKWLPPVQIDQIPDLYTRTYAAIIPNRKNPFTSINFPQRVFECGLLCRPAIVSRLPGIQAYMSDDSVQYVEPDNPESIRDGIIRLFTDKERYKSIVENALKICTSISWESELRGAIEGTVRR